MFDVYRGVSDYATILPLIGQSWGKKLEQHLFILSEVSTRRTARWPPVFEKCQCKYGAVGSYANEKDENSSFFCNCDQSQSCLVSELVYHSVRRRGTSSLWKVVPP